MEALPDISTLADPIHPGAEEGWEIIHTRTYDVRTYRTPDKKFVIRGAVADDKPAGLYLIEDPEGMRLHHMIVDLVVNRDTLVIEDARVTFRAYPGATCPAIADAYTKLIGVSLGRGFSKFVRETFGGPNGCSHTTALLLAMAPVSVQSKFSDRYYEMRQAIREDRPTNQGVARANLARLNKNTCHVWAEGSERHEDAMEGRPIAAPIPVQLRCKALGLDPEIWVRRVAE